MRATSIVDGTPPPCKLPSFCVTGLASDLANVTFHTVTLQNISVANCESQDQDQALLYRFGRFISHLAESDHVTFSAATPSVGRIWVQAVNPTQGELELHILASEHEKTVKSDFSICITAQSTYGASTEATVAGKTPFSLLVEHIDVDKINISLILRSDYGGNTAAEHLAALVATYLRSDSTDATGGVAGLEPSRVNFTPFLRANNHQVNGTNGNPTASRLLHSAFEDCVRQHPNNIAVEYLCRTSSPTPAQRPTTAYTRRDVTYAELNTEANDLALELRVMLQVLKDRWRPVVRDQYAVPLLILPSPELFVAMLAILKLGHAFSSLPSDAPVERLRAIVDDLGAPLLFGVGPAPWGDLEGSQEVFDGILWVDITNSSAWRRDLLVDDMPCTSVRFTSEDDTCYLFYTSGSTGKPKGVLGPHRAAVACVESTLHGPLSHLPAGPRLRWLSLSAPSFDPFIIDTFVPLSMGGVVCVAERDLLLTDPEACARELRATASYAVASLALLMRPEKMPELKTLIVGGESVNSRVIEKFARVHGSSHAEDDRYLINAYGPTETTIFMTAEPCTQASRSSIIGDALSSAFCLVVDPDSLDAGKLREKPFGLAGELIVGGPQVARGYLNREKETSRAFLSAKQFPELGLPVGTMLYRTGDKSRVVWSADGKPSIDFLGRIDTDQVKLNGRRVELTEIENVLAGVDGVAAVAVVVVKKPGAGSSHLIAFVSLWPDQDEQDVVVRCRAQAERLLPHWMSPETYTTLNQLPWTASGKVDRKTLVRFAVGDEVPAPSHSSNATSQQVKSVDTEKEPMDSSSIVSRGIITAIGKDAAGLDQSTSLLSLGLDSLRAMVLLQRLRDDGIEGLSLSEVLSSETVRDLTNLVQSRMLTAIEDTVMAMETQLEEDSDFSNVNRQHKMAASTSEVDNVDVSAIAIDDEEALYELPNTAKLRHFSHHCLDKCASALALTASDIEQVLPATNTQVRILYIATRPGFVDPSRYSGRPQIEHFVYDLPLDKLDPARFKRAVNVVFQRHDCFRAIFCSVDHPLFPFAMCILNKESQRCKIPTVEIVCNFDSKDNERWQNTIVSSQRAAEDSMSMDRPGVTVTWVRSADGNRDIMILSLSHAIYDGVMLSHIREEIAAEYVNPGSQPSGIQGHTDSATNLALLPIRATVELLLERSDWTETMFYWMKRLGGVPNFHIGSKRPVPRVERSLAQSGVNEITHMRRSALSSSMSMQELSKNATSSLGTTMSSVVQAAWVSVLAQTTEADGLLHAQFGSIVNGRTTQDLWRCVAPVLTTVPIHLPLSLGGNKKNPTNREVCRMLAAQNTDALPYIDIPCTSVEMFEMGHARFDTVLNLQAYRSGGSSRGSMTTEDVTMRDLPGWDNWHNLLPPFKEVDVGSVIMMELWPAFGPQGPDWDGKMTLKATYNTRRPGYEFLTEEWMAGMLNAMEDALVRILAQPDEEFYVR
jgi:amino acid adenylation domain-containing protein